MKIAKLQLKLQPTTPPEVQEQIGAAIKESLGQLDVAIHIYDQPFNQAMDLWDTLQEDAKMQQLNKKIKEAPQTCVEISMTMRMLEPLQCFTLERRQGNSNVDP